MASSVFGSPITKSTLEGLPEYTGKKIERQDRARVALNRKNDGDKALNARQYVETLERQYGVGVSTLCLVYNATGDPLTFVSAHNWSGHIGHAPYPQIIQNGQLGGFLHVKTFGVARGSVAAVVYRGKNAANEECDWMIARWLEYNILSYAWFWRPPSQ